MHRRQRIGQVLSLYAMMESACAFARPIENSRLPMISVADGAKFASVDVIDGRQKPRANERSAQIIKANEANLSEAEVIVGVFQKVLHEDLRPHQEVLWRFLRTS
jgi:hypothetical protein